MNTQYIIDKPGKAIPSKRKVGMCNNTLIYTTLVCVPVNIMGECNHSSQLQSGFQVCTNCNSTIALLNDVFEDERNKLKQTLDSIAKLKPNWDGYDAPAIGKKAIQNCKSLLGMLPNNVILDLKISPTEYGGIQVVYMNKIRGQKISIDLGDELMSFYVRESGKPTQYYSYLPIDKGHIDLLISKFSGNIA